MFPEQTTAGSPHPEMPLGIRENGVHIIGNHAIGLPFKRRDTLKNQGEVTANVGHQAIESMIVSRYPQNTFPILHNLRNPITADGMLIPGPMLIMHHIKT